MGKDMIAITLIGLKVPTDVLRKRFSVSECDCGECDLPSEICCECSKLIGFDYKLYAEYIDNDIDENFRYIVIEMSRKDSNGEVNKCSSLELLISQRNKMREDFATRLTSEEFNKMFGIYTLTEVTW